jgi:hypothetical protein
MEGYFLLADVLGFSEIIKNLSEKELGNRISEWVSLVKQTTDDFKIEYYSLLSDTLFIGVSNSECDLKKVIQVSRHLLNKGIHLCLPIRGAITYGTYEWGNLVYGKTVIDAHSLERQQNWIGVTYPNILPHVDSLWGEDSLICYPVPKKSGVIKLAPVVDWNVPDSDSLMTLMLRKGLNEAGSPLTWSWMDLVNNTVSFSIYKSIVKNTKKSYKYFHSDAVIRIIEDEIK